MRYYFLFFLLLVSYSCSREDQNPDSIRIDLSRSYGNEQLENIVDDIRLVPLETNDSCIVGQYDRVIVKGRSIFILDKMQNTVFCFDTTGKFRQKINRQGRSGQEYITGRRFYRTGQYAYCFRQQQIAITILRLSGKLCKNNTRLPGRSNRG